MGRPAIGRNADARTRLLNSLGMFQEPQQRDEGRYIVNTSLSRTEGRDVSPFGNSSVCDDTTKIPKHIRSHSDTPVRSALHNTVSFETSLNDELAIRSQNQNRIWKMRSLSLDKESRNNNAASVRFNTVVSGVKIPSRNQYSRRIKQTLWRDRYELSQMIERNTTEFFSENCDWKQVVLDDQMYVDLTSGEKVHPCHVEGPYYKRKNNDNEEEDCKEEESGFAPLSRSDSIAESN